MAAQTRAAPRSAELERGRRIASHAIDASSNATTIQSHGRWGMTGCSRTPAMNNPAAGTAGRSATFMRVPRDAGSKADMRIAEKHTGHVAKSRYRTRVGDG